MIWRRARCPSPAALERAYWSSDANVADHAAGCDRCRVAWTEIGELSREARQLVPPAPPPGRREEIRATLLSGQAATTPAPAAPGPRGMRIAWAGSVVGAAALALALGWWLGPGRPSAPAAGRSARVLDHGGASYLVASPRPDEIVRLVDGTLTLDVGAVRSGERFRVVTGDAEIEATDAALDVSARRDRLVAVRVIRGAVELRAEGEARRSLTSGQTWTAPAPTTASAVAPPAAPDPVATARDPVATTPASRVRRSRPSALDPRAPEPSPPLAPEPPAPTDAAPAQARSAAQQAFDDGWTAIRGGAFDEAASAFDRAASISAEPDVTEDALFWSAVSLARAGRATGAARGFAGFLDAYPGSARAGEASAMLGWLLLERGDLGSAERRFRAAAADRSARVRTSARAGLQAVAEARRR